MDDLFARKNQLDSRELLLLEQEVRSQGKSMAIAYLLWYFLGMFGGHRFYMGRTGSAILQLVLTLTVIGILFTFVWWVVDAIVLHTYVKEYNRNVEHRVIDNILTSKGYPPPY